MICQLQAADLLIVAGTSLKVSSASRLIRCFREPRMVSLNNEETAFDDRAAMVIHAPLDVVFAAVWPMGQLRVPCGTNFFAYYQT